MYIEEDITVSAPRPLSDVEQLLLSMPSTERLRDYLRVYTSEAHLAGTDADRRQAEWTKDKFIEFGIDNTTIETYYPLLNYPVQHHLALVSGPEEFLFVADLREDVVEGDETSKDQEAVPTFHGYSRNGSAIGPVVYANYGRIQDFEYLQQRGINLTGAIALMRYGGAYRGLKVKAAEQYGCVGALVYSDPIDDGPINKDGYPHMNPAKPYPSGPWRPESSVQRGSAVFLSVMSGDPLTPGYAATEDAPRLDIDEAPGLPKIPSLPLSYRDALPLLKAMEGRGVQGEGDWAGGLEGVGYYSGPTEGEAELHNVVDNIVTPIWNVMGVIEGSQEPDRAIILGNHRDAWVFGAVDPSSGSAAMLELANAFGQLLKQGWRPARTIILASWDAEEYGLVGSTEWVEDHSDWLTASGSVYINVDMAVSGPHFTVEASPSLNQLIYDVTNFIDDPRTNTTVYEAWSELTNRTAKPSKKPAIGKLGSGSDFVPFLQHIGIASMSMTFRGDYGVYHSNYDSFHWMEAFGDPGFHYHATMVKVWGLLALRLSDSPLLPLHPGDYADALTMYVDSLSHYADDERQDKELGATRKLTKAARRFEKGLRSVEYKVLEHKHLNSVSVDVRQRLRAINDRLVYFERTLLDAEGIQNRPWFKHVVYAPGLWTGYSAQVFPAIADALDAKDEALVVYKEKRAAKAIARAASSLHW
ncbi:hypothetical protein BX666DRAFT_1857797 [Dichotomocladium elegans]|nr:hypothetical protein BX666DRAFT_1857797 [Dichotomocladium elegans]